MEYNAVPKAVRRLVVLSSAFLVASLAISAFSAYVTLAAPLQAMSVPDKVGFEGQLADSNGSPVSDGNYTITFSLYSVATGGTSLWSEAQTVSVADGLYSVQLGSVTALDASDFDGDRWLGVQVSGDSEMTPRIAISAVPFALNARQAMGLQGRDVAATAPTDGQVLAWDNTASEWEPAAPGAQTFPDINAVDNNEDPQDFFDTYQRGAILRYIDTSTVEVSLGEVMVEGKMRRNTSAVNINFAGTGDAANLGLDTGNALKDTRYYVYAVADDDEATFDLIISASSTAPTGPTDYRKLGWFETNSNESPIEIDAGSANNASDNEYTRQFATGSYEGDGTDDRSIYVGFRPRAVYLREEGNNSVMRTDDMPDDYSCPSGANCQANNIQRFEATGFQVGSDPDVNGSGQDKYWIAWGY